MKKILVLISSLLIEIFLLLIIVTIFAFIGSKVFPSYNSSAGAFGFIGFAIFALYLLFSNMWYRSISSILLNYKYVSSKHQRIKIFLSNIIFYGYLAASTIFFVGENTIFFYKLIQIVGLIEILPCLLPKIGTRMSFYLLKIDWIDKEKIAVEDLAN